MTEPSVAVPAEHRQSAYRIGFDWGMAGALALTAEAESDDVAVVIDVLSFTTTLSVAVEAGIEVYPYPWAAADGPAYADARGAVLARGRRAALEDGSISLSPASLDGVAGIGRLVLPSPNGSAIAFALAGSGVTVVGACLRNASAVGRWLAAATGRVRVVAAGERWPDGQLRPAVEDLWGAGAVLAGLDLSGASPEARAAVAAYDVVRSDLGHELAGSASGRELLAAGFGRDLDLASALDVARVVPVLSGESFADRGTQDG